MYPMYLPVYGSKSADLLKSALDFNIRPSSFSRVCSFDWGGELEFMIFRSDPPSLFRGFEIKL